MNSEYEVEIKLEQFKNAHIKETCSGSFQLISIEKLPLHLDSIGYIQVSNVPMVSCAECDAAYIMPGFEDFISKVIAKKLILSPNVLSPKEIRFLRLTTDSKQKEIADFIDCGRTYYAKCEIEKSETHKLSIGRQKLLKIFHAKKLGLAHIIVDNLDQIKEETLSKEELIKTISNEIGNFHALAM